MAQGQLSGGGGNATKTGLSTPDSGARIKDGEEARVIAWRCSELEAAGMSHADAEMYSHDFRALDLVRRGCPLELIEDLLT